MRFWTVAFGAALFAFAGNAVAGSSAMIVLDASGSMAGRIDGTPRITIARSGIAAAMPAVPPELPVGLVAYGHRDKASCTDVEVVAAPVAGNAAAVAAAAGRINPLGRTPMAAALRQAAESADYRNQRATIVLITDGQDNCSGDPCALAQELRDGATDLTIDVLALSGSREEDPTNVACLAETTGGTFRQVASGADIAAELGMALKAEPPEPLPVATIQAPEAVQQRQVFDIAFSGPRLEGDQIQIAWPGMGPEAFISSVEVAAADRSGHLTAPFERGTYELRYWLPSRARIIARQTFRVDEIVPAIIAPPTVGQGTMFPVRWKGQAAQHDRIAIARPGSGPGEMIFSVEVREDTGQAILDAPAEPGHYELRMIRSDDGSVALTRPIEVAAVEVALTPPAAVNAGAAFAVSWKGPAASFDQIVLARPAMGPQEELAAVRIDADGGPVSLVAPLEPGRYELRYRSARSRTVLGTVGLEVKAAAVSLDAPARVAGGAPVTITWTGPGAPGDRIAITTTDGMALGAFYTVATPADGAPATIEAPVAAGDYRIAYLSAEGLATLATRELRVEAPSVDLQVGGAIHPGGVFEVDWKGPDGRYDQLRLAPANSDRNVVAAASTAAGSPARLLAPEEPGDYLLSYWSDRAGQALATVRVTVGTPPVIVQ